MATIVSPRTTTRRKAAVSLPALPEVVEVTPKTAADWMRLLHLTRPDGTACFAAADEAKECKHRWKQWHAAIRETGNKELRAVAKRAERRDGPPAKKQKRVGKPACSYHSEAMRTTVLRTDWSSSAVQVAVDWSQPNMRCEIVAGSDELLSGIVSPQVIVDGRRLTPVGPWEEVCWETDGDADYLELEISLGGGLRLQRQFLLTRTDGLLYMADAILGASRADLELTFSLPLAAGTKFAAAVETRDGMLISGSRKRLVLPTALSEWRNDGRNDVLGVIDGKLTLRQSARQAVALYAPLCFVVDPQKAGKAVTWRRLTIGENLQLQPADKAVGYRVQVGREQWLVYRSLTPRANRTVLGVNLQTDFLCARFLADGTIERLMEIEE